MDMYILSDPVTNFWKCSKKRFKRVLKGGSNWTHFFWHGGQLAKLILLVEYVSLSELKTRGVLGSLRVRFWMRKKMWGENAHMAKICFLGQIGFIFELKKGALR